MKRNFTKSKVSIADCFAILSTSDRKKLVLVSIVQSSLNILDLLGIALVGLISAASISHIQNSEESYSLNLITNILAIERFSFKIQISILASLMLFFFVARTVFSMYFTNKILQFLCLRGVLIADRTIEKLLTLNSVQFANHSLQEKIYLVTKGIEMLSINVLTSSTILFADTTLLFLIGIALLIYDPITAISSLLIFGGVSVLLYLHLHKRIEFFGQENSNLNIELSNRISEAFNTFRELRVRNAQHYYVDKIESLNIRLAANNAHLGFVPYISKYIIETAVIVGALIIGIFQFVIHDLNGAISSLAIFLVAGTRLTPAVLRIQQGLVSIRAYIGRVRPVLELIRELDITLPANRVERKLDFEHIGFIPTVKMENLTVNLDSDQEPVLKNVNIMINAGTTTAVIGPSGSGKSTLLDAIIGVAPLQAGKILISGMDINSAITEFPGAISFVPQDIYILEGTIRENIAFGFPSESIDDAQIWRSIQIAQLQDFVESLPQGINHKLGDNGINLSGGQKQRINLARAMYTNPRLLILDEATSALDEQTESAVNLAIRRLGTNLTVLVATHRVSTIGDVDEVIYMLDGSVIATGSFAEVKAQVENFDINSKESI